MLAHSATSSDLEYIIMNGTFSKALLLAKPLHLHDPHTVDTFQPFANVQPSLFTTLLSLPCGKENAPNEFNAVFYYFGCSLNSWKCTLVTVVY